MPSEVTINPRLKNLLKNLPKEVTKEVEEEYKTAAEIVKYEMLSRVPVENGDLAASIGIKRGFGGKFYDIGAGLSGKSRIKGMMQSIAQWVEYGTSPHKIKTHKKKILSIGGEEFAGKEVMHPGTPPRPFIRPSIEASREDVVQHLNRVINKVLRRFGNV
jgi:HK97 gp10 family phage protein